MKRILGSLVAVLALGTTTTLFADEDLPSKIDVVIVEPSSSSVASSGSAASSGSVTPKSSSSQGGTVASSGSNASTESGSSQEDDAVTPGSSTGTAAIRRVGVPSAALQGDKWFDTKGRRLEKRPAASGSYVNNGKMQTVK